MGINVSSLMETGRQAFKLAEHKTDLCSHRGGGFVLLHRVSLGIAATAPNQVCSWLVRSLTEYVARRQLQGEWSRSVEYATGLPFSTISQMKSYDNPSTSLLEPLDLIKLNGIQDQVLIATDVDDTLLSTGGVRTRVTGSRLGGVDSKYPAGVSYPGMGGLMYLLSMGSRKRDAGKFRPVETQVLPVMLLTARPNFLKRIFRPASLYKHIAAMYLREASLLGARIAHPNAQVKYENRSSFIGSVLKGKIGEL